MPANSKAGYALFNLDPVRDAKIFKNHRDYFAHSTRWEHVSSKFPSVDEDPEEFFNYEQRAARDEYIPSMLKYTHFAKYFTGGNMEYTVLDLGCGPGAYMGRFLYSNRRRVAHYVGVDYRTPKPDYTPHFPATFMQGDVTLWETYEKAFEALGNTRPDVIVTLEVLEHMSKEKGIMFLDNIYHAADMSTEIYLSTPCHDNKHLPHDHVYEWQHSELKAELEDRFNILENYGTFASQVEIKPVLTPAERELFDKLSKYYDSSMLSCIFAPLHPAESRNSIWHLRKKEIVFEEGDNE